MDKPQYHLGQTTHTLDVFHFYTSAHLIKFSCSMCKLNDTCKNIKHKQDICPAVKDIEKILLQYVLVRVNTFYRDCFYLSSNPQKTHRFVQKIQTLLNNNYQK